jgi:hypothetical protein
MDNLWFLNSLSNGNLYINWDLADIWQCILLFVEFGCDIFFIQANVIIEKENKLLPKHIAKVCSFALGLIVT